MIKQSLRLLSNPFNLKQKRYDHMRLHNLSLKAYQTTNIITWLWIQEWIPGNMNDEWDILPQHARILPHVPFPFPTSTQTTAVADLRHHRVLTKQMRQRLLSIQKVYMFVLQGSRPFRLIFTQELLFRRLDMNDNKWEHIKVIPAKHYRHGSGKDLHPYPLTNYLIKAFVFRQYPTTKRG